MRKYYNQSFFIILMENSTNIHDLPTGNVTLSINEKPVNSESTPQINSNSLDQNTINQIISSLQQAGTNGATQLQSRDIPQNTENIINDPQVQANYMPTTKNNDYITENEETDDIIQNYTRSKNMNNSLDNLYDEIQLPLLISILYFLFQLPIFKKYMFQYLPVLCLNDGNVNLYGYLFNSILFGFIYFILSKTIGNFNKF